MKYGKQDGPERMTLASLQLVLMHMHGVVWQTFGVPPIDVRMHGAEQHMIGTLRTFVSRLSVSYYTEPLHSKWKQVYIRCVTLCQEWHCGVRATALLLLRTYVVRASASANIDYRRAVCR